MKMGLEEGTFVEPTPDQSADRVTNLPRGTSLGESEDRDGPVSVRGAVIRLEIQRHAPDHLKVERHAHRHELIREAHAGQKLLNHTHCRQVSMHVYCAFGAAWHAGVHTRANMVDGPKEDSEVKAARTPSWSSARHVEIEKFGISSICSNYDGTRALASTKREKLKQP